MKNDEGVVPKTFPVDGRDNAADLIIHARHHCRIGAARGLLDILVAVDIFLRRLIGRVRRSKGQIKIERFVGILRIDVFHRILAYELGCVAFLAGGLVVAEPVQHAVFVMREVI